MQKYSFFVSAYSSLRNTAVAILHLSLVIIATVAAVGVSSQCLSEATPFDPPLPRFCSWTIPLNCEVQRWMISPIPLCYSLSLTLFRRQKALHPMYGSGFMGISRHLVLATPLICLADGNYHRERIYRGGNPGTDPIIFFPLSLFGRW